MSLRSERVATAAWIRLDRPEKRNALSPDMLRRLDAALDDALADAEARSIVITGRGPAFCAGADLELGRELASSKGPNPFAAVLDKIRTCPKPVIAAVNGAAYGGGLGLVAAADIAVAARSAVFSFSEVRLGLVPAMISVFVVPKIGPHHARRLFTTGRRFDADEALAFGLLHRVVDDDPDGAALDDAVQDEAADIALGAPGAVAAAKRLVFELPRLAAADALDRASELFAERVASEEGREGLAAFGAKRAPSWVRE